jgi:hypothetical protein
LGLNKDDAQDLNAASIESFPSLSVSEARLVLDKIIRRTTFSGIHDELSEEEKESSTLSFFPLRLLFAAGSCAPSAVASPSSLCFLRTVLASATFQPQRSVVPASVQREAWPGRNITSIRSLQHTVRITSLPSHSRFDLHFPLHRKLHCQKSLHGVWTTGSFICEHKTSKYVDLVVCFRSGENTEKHALSKREHANNFDCENKTSKYVRFKVLNLWLQLSEKNLAIFFDVQFIYHYSRLFAVSGDRPLNALAGDLKHWFDFVL